MRLAIGKMKACTVIVLALFALFIAKANAQQEGKEYVNKQLPMEHMSGLLRLVETFPIPTEGYMDHLTYDLKNQHLFLSAENNKEVMVVDMKAGKVIQVVKVEGN